MPVEELLTRHATLSREAADLPVVASSRTAVVCCMDHRVDPADFLGLAPGEAIVIRNMAGRVTEDVIRHLAYLQLLSRTFLEDEPVVTDVLVVHHTNCGSRALELDQVATSFRTLVGDPDLDLAGLAVTDPAATLTADVQRLRSDARLQGLRTVRGAVYDVISGRLDAVTV